METFSFFFISIFSLIAVFVVFFLPLIYGVGALFSSVQQFLQNPSSFASPTVAVASRHSCETFDFLTNFTTKNFQLAFFETCSYFGTALKSFILAFATTVISLLFASIISARLFITKEQLKMENPKFPFLIRIIHSVSQKGVALALAFPHVAFVLALGFLLTPSGLLFRVLAFFFNWNVPPEVFLTSDEAGWFYVVALSVREIPFLLFFMLAENNSKNVSLYELAQFSGRYHFNAWLFAVFPSIYEKVRLPLMLVFTYSLCNVEIALIAGPQNPRLLPLQIFELLYFYEEPAKNFAAFLSLWLSFFLLVGIGIFIFLEKCIVFIYCKALVKGLLIKGFHIKKKSYRWFFRSRFKKRRRRSLRFFEMFNTFKKGVLFEKLIFFVGYFVWWAIGVIFTMSLVVLVFWSITLRWPFPKVLPESYTFKFWQEALHSEEIVFFFNDTFHFFSAYTSNLLAGEQAANSGIQFSMQLVKNFSQWLMGNALTSSLLLAAFSTIAAVVVSVLCLESVQITKILQAEKKSMLTSTAKSIDKVLEKMWWFVLPLLFFPELVILPGVKQFFLSMELNFFFACVWGHFIFVFPYTYLNLRRWYLQFDATYITMSRVMGKNYWHAIVRVKWVMLAQPIFFTAALAATVSFSQYLSTLFFGGGRVLTVTTEAVNLFQSGNRRVVSVYALLQGALPFFVLLSAMFFAAKYNYEEDERS